MNYETKSLVECRKIKAALEDRCKACEDRLTEKCMHCYNIILRRDVELCIRRIVFSDEYALVRDMLRHICNTSVDCDTCVYDCDGYNPCQVTQNTASLLKRYNDLYGELV